MPKSSSCKSWCGYDLIYPIGSLAPTHAILISRILKAFLARRLKRRLFVAHELLATEEHYVKALSVVCEIFYYPLLRLLEQSKADGTEGTSIWFLHPQHVSPLSHAAVLGRVRAAPLKKSEDIEAVFSVVDKLYIHHKEFSEYLKERVLDWEAFARLSLGDIFIDKTGTHPLHHSGRAPTRSHLLRRGSLFRTLFGIHQQL